MLTGLLAIQKSIVILMQFLCLPKLSGQHSVQSCNIIQIMHASAECDIQIRRYEVETLTQGRSLNGDISTEG